jgi:integrase
VFPTKTGNIDNRGNILRDMLWPTQVAAGVTTAAGKPKYMGLHALRHFFASWCINRKADGGLELPAKMVQDRLGHASIVMTMDTYSHLFPVLDDGAELARAELRLVGPRPA